MRLNGGRGPEPANDEALRRPKNTEGQVRGLLRMVGEHCAADTIWSPDRKTGARVIDELMSVLEKAVLYPPFTFNSYFSCILNESSGEGRASR